MKPIALTGKFRSGKDVIAAHLVERYGYTRFAFGDELKRYANELFPHESEAGRKPRELYQWFGQTMRQRDPDVWVRKCFEYITHRNGVMDVYFEAPWNAHAKVPFLPVISDVRQPNEYDRCRSEGYVIIRVTRPDSDRLATAATTDNFDGAAINHETESYVDGFAVDYEIVNDGTVDDLLRKVDEVMADINGKRLT